MKLLIIDGHNYLFRSYYGVPPQKRDGGPHLVYTFLSSLRRMVDTLNPTHLAIVFDSETGTAVKKGVREEYKATRQEHDNEVFVQKKVLDAVLKKIGIFTLEHADYEGDDVIGSLAVQCAQKGLNINIASADFDFSQLVNEQISLIREHKGVYDIVTPQRIKERFGIQPIQYVDYISLKGDNSDNIKGIKGVGPKVARQLIDRWGSLETLLENCDYLPEKWARLFENEQERIISVRNFLRINSALALLPESSQAFEFSHQSLMTPTRYIIDSI
ncbi:MAG: 5'-3' exonuclease [bacterium]|nr:5'-3' exonuclease [bacterium]